MSFEFYFPIVMYPKIMFFIDIFQLFKILVHCTKERMGLELAPRTYLVDFCSEFCIFGFGAVCSPQRIIAQISAHVLWAGTSAPSKALKHTTLSVDQKSH